MSSRQAVPTMILCSFSFLFGAGFSLQLLLVFRSVTSVRFFPVTLTNLSEQILEGEGNLIDDGVEDIAADGLQQDPTEEQT